MMHCGLAAFLGIAFVAVSSRPAQAPKVGRIQVCKGSNPRPDDCQAAGQELTHGFCGTVGNRNGFKSTSETTNLY